MIFHCTREPRWLPIPTFVGFWCQDSQWLGFFANSRRLMARHPSIWPPRLGLSCPNRNRPPSNSDGKFRCACCTFGGTVRFRGNSFSNSLAECLGYNFCFGSFWSNSRLCWDRQNHRDYYSGTAPAIPIEDRRGSGERRRSFAIFPNIPPWTVRKARGLFDSFSLYMRNNAAIRVVLDNNYYYSFFF